MASINEPTFVHFGDHALESLRAFKGQRVLIVTDSFLRTTPLMKTVVGSLGLNVHIFDEVKPDPTTETVGHLVDLALRIDPDVMIAIGGGSPIDAAKGCVLVMAQRDDRPHFVVIPTTCGSGSEVTPYLVLTDDEGTKLAFTDHTTTPDEAILSYAAVETLPASICADTGMDALTHAFEAYLSKTADVFSDTWAIRAIELLSANLVDSVAGNREARSTQLYASTMAGYAFARAGLGIVHSLSHAVGGHFHKPHGRVNAVLLTAVLEFNAGLPSPSSDEELRVVTRLAALAQRLGFAKDTPVESAKAVIDHVAQLRAGVGIPDSISGLGVSETPSPSLLDELAAMAIVDPCTPTNSRSVTPALLTDVLHRAW